MKSNASKHVLMVDADHYNVEYAINNHMLDANGQLRQVNKSLAKQQWQALRQTFLDLGIRVDVLASVDKLPDMVYAANQSFPFLHPKTGQKTVIMSQMKSDFRQPEVRYFERYYEHAGFEVKRLTNPDLFFEANGDALIHPGKSLIWGGYGLRTQKEAYAELQERFGFEVNLLQLTHPAYYHLDTCFSILADDCVAFVPEAFTQADVGLIRSHFGMTIAISDEEGQKYFAGNCFSPDGHTVIMQKGAQGFKQDLERNGFQVVEVETSEFIKGGGSVFCMKMELPNSPH